MKAESKLRLNAQKLILNELVMRQAYLQRLLDPRRNIDAECGHPSEILTSDYKYAYERGDVAARIVSAMPEECWKKNPDIYETEDETETEFEKAWQELNKKLSLIAMLRHADVLSGIGRFGIILLGIDDGKDLAEPIEGVNDDGTGAGSQERNLLFIRPFEETLVQVTALESNPRNPRFGQPVSYNVNFVDVVQPPLQLPAGGVQSIQTMAVHWTRVIHLADNRINSPIYGEPRMKKVFNRILDLKKVLGGSAEMFWKGGFPGLSVQSHPNLDLANVELDKNATKQEMEDYMNGLQRYIMTLGLDVKSLTTQIADPTTHIDGQCKMIAATLAIPWRILFGSEQAQLASGQDSSNWNERLEQRQCNYVTPFVIRPFVDRLMAAGCLPTVEEYEVHWPDLNIPSQEEEANVAQKRSLALSQYVTSGSDSILPPFHFLTLILGMEDDEATSALDEAINNANDLNEETTQTPRTGNAPNHDSSTPPPPVVMPPAAGGRNGNGNVPAIPGARN